MARGRPLLQFRARPKAEENRLKFLPPNGAEYVRDWTALAPGDRLHNAATGLSSRPSPTPRFECCTLLRVLAVAADAGERS